jgi:catechol 2,3-dioxygenase-like lactoylglutathione lyase family enzyme
VPSLDAIGIVTSNLAESLRFYSLLGVTPTDDHGEHVEAKLVSGIRLMWDTEEMIRKIDPDWQPPTGQRVGLAFLCENVDETYAAVTEAGFDGAKEPFDAFWGQRYATVRDPDGNAVDLFAPL